MKADSKSKKETSKNFFFEIGTEELPVDALDVFSNSLPGRLEDALRKAQLSFKATHLGLTPRRVTIFIEELSAYQEDEVLEITGPRKEQAYDSSGKPTKALLGFLRSKRISEKDIFITKSRGSECVAAKITKKGGQTKEVIPQILEQVVESLPFPKRMRWDNSGFRFPRPVRWCLAVHGNAPLSFSFAGVRTKPETCGHRFLSKKAIRVSSADQDSYERLLAKNHVVLDSEDRKRLIRNGIKRREKTTPLDERLIHITSFLVEEPFLIEGSFKKDYLKLPEEILYTVMKKYQRIFAVYSAKGKILDRFIAVINGRRKEQDLKRMRIDYERVLESRLNDAQFFYQEDTKLALDDRKDKLSDLIFMKGLGTFADKEHRLGWLTTDITSERGDRLQGLTQEEENSLRQAASICKRDLTTQMVFEFPELQGVMGREYALHGGKPLEVARTISEHYLPKSLTEDYKELSRKLSRVGAVLGILDRLDTLAGTFAMGLEPTGSQDPYALRRTAGGFVKLIRAFNLRFRWHTFADKLLGLYRDEVNADLSDPRDKLERFIKERVIAELQAKPGTREYELLQGVLASGCEDIAEVFSRCDVLLNLLHKNKTLFEKAFKVVERTSNILKGAEQEVSGEPNASLFSEPEERKLYELYEKNALELEKLIRDEKYAEVVSLYTKTFFEPLHVFFDKVLVNVDEAAIRENRLALMKKINRIFVDNVADLSLMTHMEIKT